MEEAGRKERAEHEANIASDLAPGKAPKHKERLPEKLVPALRPKLMQRLRRPRVVHHGRPRARRVAQHGDGEERDEVVDHAEPGDECRAGQDVYRGRDEVAAWHGQVRKEYASAEGVADARNALDGRVEDIQEQEGGEEREERRAEEGLAFLRPRGRGRVHALAKVPPETAQREHEFERILEPQREESVKLAIACRRRRRRRRRMLRRIGGFTLSGGGDGRDRHASRDGFALLVATCLGESEIDALAHKNKGKGGHPPVVYIVPRIKPNVAVR